MELEHVTDALFIVCVWISFWIVFTESIITGFILWLIVGVIDCIRNR